jgi:hypothetical protein
VSKRPRKHPKAFDAAAYRKHTDEVWQKRMAGFDGLLTKAITGDREPLIDYFRYHGTVSEEQASSMAWFLQRALPRSRRRRRGPQTVQKAMLIYASCLLRIGKHVWRRNHTYQHEAFNGAVDRLAARAIELVEEEFPNMRGRLSLAAVRDYNKPIKKNEVLAGDGDDFLPHAIAKMKQEALN